MEVKLKELYPTAKHDANETYSVVNDDLKIRFADMPNESNSLLFSLVLHATNIPETIKFYEKVGLELIAEDENNAVLIFKALETC